MSSTHYKNFLDHSIGIFLNILKEGKPHFIAEYNIQQVRKLILEMLYRLPTNDLLKRYVQSILSLMLRLLEIDNEENVLVCLKIIIELHKHFRPTFNTEVIYRGIVIGFFMVIFFQIQDFLVFVKGIYSDLPDHMDKIFEPRAPIKVKYLSELNIEEMLKETFTMTPIQTEERNKDNTLISVSFLCMVFKGFRFLEIKNHFL